MDGPPDAEWRLGDALKTEFLAPGAALKSHGELFQRRLNTGEKKTLPLNFATIHRRNSAPTGNFTSRPFRSHKKSDTTNHHHLAEC